MKIQNLEQNSGMVMKLSLLLVVVSENWICGGGCSGDGVLVLFLEVMMVVMLVTLALVSVKNRTGKYTWMYEILFFLMFLEAEMALMAVAKVS